MIKYVKLAELNISIATVEYTNLNTQNLNMI